MISMCAQDDIIEMLDMRGLYNAGRMASAPRNKVLQAMMILPPPEASSERWPPACARCSSLMRAGAHDGGRGFHYRLAWRRRARLE